MQNTKRRNTKPNKPPINMSQKNSLNKKADSTVFRNSDGFNTMLGKNIPLIEITDLDLLHKNRRNNKEMGANNRPGAIAFSIDLNDNPSKNESNRNVLKLEEENNNKLKYIFYFKK
jgi:hypothetical protein